MDDKKREYDYVYPSQLLPIDDESTPQPSKQTRRFESMIQTAQAEQQATDEVIQVQ